MSSLFVAEDVEGDNFADTRVKVENDIDMNVVDTDVQMQEAGDIITVKSEFATTIDTEAEQKKESVNEYYEDSDSDEEDADDPIIDTIPVHLNSNVEQDGNKLAPLLLQFPTKSRQSNLSQNHISALHRLQIKADSGVVELRLPLNTDAFFSGTVSEKYNVNEQFLRGVIIHDEPAGTINDGTVPSVSVIDKGKPESEKSNPSITSSSSAINPNTTTIRAQPGSVGGSRYLIGVQDQSGRLHVTPMSDTCMLRPHFTYIDDAKMSKLEREREIQRELNDTRSEKVEENNVKEEEKKKNVSVVTMSAKSTRENVPRLGGALLSAKLEMEEEGKKYDIMPCGEEFITTHFTDKSGNVLHSRLTQTEYLDLLLEQTKM